MRDAFEVLKRKEQELLRVTKEVEALRIVAKLFEDQKPEADDNHFDLKNLAKMP